MQNRGQLYVVATPIGNPGDITLRALDVLRQCNAVICEEQREGEALLKKYEIPAHEIITLNEHNEAERVPDIVRRILLTGDSLALISDCGTPVFSDPGAALIQHASEMSVPVIPVPGASSLMAALSILSFKPERFVFAGFLPRVPEERKRELLRLRALRMPVILMDTPYRLVAVLKDVANAFGKGHQVTLAADLTLPREKIYRGPVGEVLQQVGERKAEFILIVH
ncbi:MAG TPA: 16S rRNA (cytidine(1402)-2'-O)-methyltransferase [Anaerolineaceae bacterium]|nr:16S rRNA (cytidine(1402)-2'-O)-methyltransferase [Anaerolineaceae bacterium]